MSKRMEITAREIRLLREEAKSIIDSNHHRGERTDRQPWQWHEGQELMALCRKLERYRKGKA